MVRAEYMAAFRLGAPVVFRGIRYKYISAVVCRRMINKSQSMDAPRLYVELELLDNCGHSVTLANPAEVDVVDAEMFAAAVQASKTVESKLDVDAAVAAEPEKPEEPEKTEKPKRKRFVKPTAEDILGYCAEKGYTHVDVDAFMAHYESVGWRVGKNPMVSWRAAVTGWETREKKETATERKETTREGTSSFATEDFFAAAVRRSYGGEM